MDYGFFNMDCMEGMKNLPDKSIALAVVDPPYGDPQGGGWNRFGQRFDRYKTRTGSELQEPGRLVACGELAEHGRRSTQKNHCVGRCPRERVFSRAFPRLTEPDYMGGGTTSNFRRRAVSSFGRS